MKALRATLFHAGLLLLMAAVLFPLHWVVVTSFRTGFKTGRDAFAIPPVWFFTPTLESCATVLANRTFLRAFANSFVASISPA